MKTFGIFLVFTCLLLQTFSKPTAWVESLSSRDVSFTDRNDEIVFPQTTFSGEFQLLKQLTAEKEQERKGAERSFKTYSREVTPSFTDQLHRVKTTFFTDHPATHFSYYKERTYTTPHFSRFHPPSRSLFGN